MNILRLSAVAALLQDAQTGSTGNTTVLRVGAGVIALVLVAIVILRRKRTAKKESEEDEF